MKNKRFITVAALLIAFVLAFTGCQSIGSFDINQALISNLTTQSFEAKSTVSVEFMWDEDKELDVDMAMIKELFDNAKLELYDMKVQDANNMSMRGSVHLPKGEIGFAVIMNNEMIVFEVDGVDQPIVFDLTMGEEYAAQLQQMNEMIADVTEQLTEGIGSFVVHNLPNPQNIHVSSGFESINGESVFLHNLQVEIRADEFIGLIKDFLASVLNDEAGLKSVIGLLYDVVLPLVDDMFNQPVDLELLGIDVDELSEEEVQQLEESFSTDPLADFRPMLEDRESAIEMAYAMLIGYLTPLVEDANEQLDAMQEVGSDFLNENNYVKYDMYFDNSLAQRKQSIEMVLTAPSEDNQGLAGIRITSEDELWNVNQEVTIDEIDISNALNIDYNMKSAHLLKQLDPDSVLYEILLDDLELHHKHISLHMPAGETTPSVYQRPYITEGTTMVPVRFVSDRLDADVSWDGDLNQVTVVDVWSNKEIVLVIGNRDAIVDGEQVQLEVSPVLSDGTTYVPVRFIAEALGATVDWDPEHRMVKITKE